MCIGMENFSIFGVEGQKVLTERLVNSAIKRMRLDQAILVSENREMAEAFTNFFLSLMECWGECREEGVSSF